MSNSSYSSNQSLGGNFNYNLDSTKIVDKKEKPQQGGISSVGYNSENSLNVNASKTLATLGEGNITIKDIENSDEIERLNTDTTNLNKELYSSSTSTSVDATLDTRLLSLNGINQIKDEAKTASTMLTSINQILSTNRATVIDFFSETDKNVKVLDGIKSTIASNPELAKQLSDPNIKPEEKQLMINNVATTVAISLGYLAPNTKLVYTDETGASNEQIKGHYSIQTDTSYVNDKNNDSIVELVNTTVHEIQHYMDAKDNLIIKDKVDNEKYVNNFANTVTDYTNYALEYTGNQSMATTNNYNNQTKNITSVPSVFNMSSLLTINNQEFGSLDKSLGEDSVYLYNGKVVAIDKDKNDKVIILSDEDKERLLKDNVTTQLVEFSNFLNQYISAGDIKEVLPMLSTQAQDDLINSQVYYLNNEQDFNFLQKGTDMGYVNSDENTRVYFANGMDNNSQQALNSAKNIESLVNQPVGSIINSTDGIVGDVKEYLEQYNIKDVLNEYTYRKLNDLTPKGETTTIIMHSAGNADAVKAISIGNKQGYSYPNLQFVSAGSPVSKSYLNNVFTSAGSSLVGQINDWKDPVTHSKTVGVAVIGIGLVGGYLGVKYMPNLIPASQILTGTQLGQFLISVGSAGVGAGVGASGIIMYHPMEKYLEKPELKGLIQQSVFPQEKNIKK